MSFQGFDYSELSVLIAKKVGLQYDFAKKMELSERSLSLKLNNKVRWKDTEIDKACKILKISHKNIPKYFFKPKVKIFEQSPNHERDAG